MTTKPLVIATDNLGKLREFTALLAPLGYRAISQRDAGVKTPFNETGATLRDNALGKARHAMLLTGRPALADDSGLEVEALGGAPGVHSARYAGPQADDAANCAKLLQALNGVPQNKRRARFRCVLVLLEPGSEPLICEGEWAGSIATEPSGSGGFGYDPLFEPDDAPHTAARLSACEKNRLSHRARAFAKLRGELERRENRADPTDRSDRSDRTDRTDQKPQT